MPNEAQEQQETLSTEEVVSLLNEDVTSTPVRKGYEDYVKEAQAEATTEVDEQTPKESVSTFDMPSKFEGKSAEEIAASYIELQSEYGRKSNEVGSLRNLTDQLLELKEKPNETEQEPTKVTADSLLENPNDVINTAVDNSPRLKALEAKALKDDLATAKASFEDKYPKWETTVHSAEFQAWISESAVRQGLLLEANNNYNYALGAELLSMYDLAKGNAIKEATTDRNSKARKSAKQAVTETGGATETKGKPKYRRTELIQLKLTNPRKYEAMQAEIMAAYAENRVI